jgi:hypothetical protein
MDRGRFSGNSNSTQQQHPVQKDTVISAKQRALLADRCSPLHADLLECCHVAAAAAATAAGVAAAAATANVAAVTILKDVLRDMYYDG